jgi:hypothetical protein
MTGFSPSGRLAALTWFNEAGSGSLALRLTGSLHGASTRELLPALSASLHAGRSVGMMNTFQFMSWFGGAGAPEGNEGTKIPAEIVSISCYLEPRITRISRLDSSWWLTQAPNDCEVHWAGDHALSRVNHFLCVLSV